MLKLSSAIHVQSKQAESMRASTCICYWNVVQSCSSSHRLSKAPSQRKTPILVIQEYPIPSLCWSPGGQTLGRFPAGKKTLAALHSPSTQPLFFYQTLSTCPCQDTSNSVSLLGLPEPLRGEEGSMGDRAVEYRAHLSVRQAERTFDSGDQGRNVNL
jgi:hypothetical protein